MEIKKGENNLITIIVTAYNRPFSLKRILSSIKNAEYPINNINLVISIDKSKSNDVLNVAENFQWNTVQKSLLSIKKT